jgi:hypothetical protein
VYLTAQRVVSPQGVQGVNVYEYLHGPVNWTHPLPRELYPEINPGQLHRWSETTPSGGNAVISYLDIVVPEIVPDDAIARWLAVLKNSIQVDRAPREYAVGPMWVRFGISRSGVPPQTELAALAAHILLRLFNPPQPR